VKLLELDKQIIDASEGKISAYDLENKKLKEKVDLYNEIYEAEKKEAQNIAKKTEMKLRN